MVPLQLPNAVGQDRHVLLLSCNNYITDVTFPLLKDKAFSLGSAPSRPVPAIHQIFALAESLTPYTLTRPAADTLVLQVTQPEGLSSLRLPTYGFAPGEVVHYEGVVIEVLAVSTAGNPTGIRYRFKPGELDRYEVMEWQNKQFVPAQLPAVGGSLVIRTNRTNQAM